MRTPPLCHHLEIQTRITGNQGSSTFPWTYRRYVADWSPPADIGPYTSAVFAIECQVQEGLGDGHHKVEAIYHSPMKSSHLREVRRGRSRTAHECRWTEGYGEPLTRPKSGGLASAICYEGTLRNRLSRRLLAAFNAGSDNGVFAEIDAIWREVFKKEYQLFLRLTRNSLP